jgi:N utilization substance protein B
MSSDISSGPPPDDSSQKGTAPPTRHASRELSLQILFQWDFHGQSDARLEEYWSNQHAESEGREFAEVLVSGVLNHVSELDALISNYAIGWTIKRMPVVDRNILRQSLFELLFIPDIPAKVTLNEALQLAKTFADEETKRFINGLLDQIFKKEARLAVKRQELPA